MALKGRVTMPPTSSGAMPELVIAPDDPCSEDVRALLGAHLAFSRRVTPPGHVHALDVDGLLEPAVTFFSARRDGLLLGVGAIKRLSPDHAELKSMHTSETARRQGVASALVAHLLAFAATSNYARVSIETGTMDAFAPARSLYAKFGFVPCEPFASYTANPHSTCMTISLGPHTAQAAQAAQAAQTGSQAGPS
jgi:putative acetyltransferase